MSGSHRHGWYYPHPTPPHPNFLKWARLHVRFLTRWHKYPDPPTKLYCSSRCIAAEDDVKGISHTGHWARISVGESDAASASRGESVMANRIWAWLSNKQNVVIWFNKLWIILAAKNWNQSQFCVCLLVKFIEVLSTFYQEHEEGCFFVLDYTRIEWVSTCVISLFTC